MSIWSRIVKTFTTVDENQGSVLTPHPKSFPPKDTRSVIQPPPPPANLTPPKLHSVFQMPPREINKLKSGIRKEDKPSVWKPQVTHMKLEPQAEPSKAGCQGRITKISVLTTMHEEELKTRFVLGVTPMDSTVLVI